jgi:hypothetical protein
MKAQEAKQSPYELIPDWFGTPELRDALARCFDYDPTQRPSMAALVQCLGPNAAICMEREMQEMRKEHRYECSYR